MKRETIDYLNNKMADALGDAQTSVATAIPDEQKAKELFDRITDIGFEYRRALPDAEEYTASEEEHREGLEQEFKGLRAIRERHIASEVANSL